MSDLTPTERAEFNIKKPILIKLMRLIVRVLGMDVKDFDARVAEIEAHPKRFTETAVKIKEEYREIKMNKDESLRMYSYRVLGTMLPKLNSRDEAMDALMLVYPFISKENALMKIAGALYFTRRDVDVTPRDGCPMCQIYREFTKPEKNGDAWHFVCLCGHRWRGDAL